MYMYLQRYAISDYKEESWIRANTFTSYTTVYLFDK